MVDCRVKKSENMMLHKLEINNVELKYYLYRNWSIEYGMYLYSVAIEKWKGHVKLEEAKTPPLCTSLKRGKYCLSMLAENKIFPSVLYEVIDDWFGEWF